MKVYIDTYGCTFNKADAQIMGGVLKENHIDLVDSPELADVIIVNTCYVKLPTENKVVYKRSLQPRKSRGDKRFFRHFL